jgi:hypothetical protein
LIKRENEQSEQGADEERDKENTIYSDEDRTNEWMNKDKPID